MMRKITIIALLLFVWGSSWAQSPDLINYQAVARDLSGNPLVSTPVNVIYEVRETSANGSVVYSESHNLTTNQFGLFTAKIGGGTPISGTFSGITWGLDIHYLQVTINGDVMPSTQLLSVPYALHAGTATSGTPGANGHANLADSVAEPAGVNCANGGYLIHMGADDNDNNILEPLERDISYYICNGLDGTANNNDTSATNEIQTISISNDTVFLSKGGMFVKLPSALGDDWGSQVVISSGSNISGNGTSASPLMVTDSVDDADNDPNNERITTFALNVTNDSIIIVEAGVGHAFPLSNLNDGDWTKGTGADLFNNSDSVGVGTNNPKSLFQIGDNMHLFPFSIPGPEEYAVTSYNSHHDGSIIKNTTGGVSGFSFIGHKTGQPNYGVHLFNSQPAGTDMTLLTPDLAINLSKKGFGVNTDSPDAGIDVEPLDSAGIIIRLADNGSTANLFFEDTQNRTVGLKAPTVLGGNYGLTLPINLPSTTGSSLVSDLAGNLSWAAPQSGSLWNNLPPNINYTAGNVAIGTTTASSLLTIGTLAGNEIEFVGTSNADIMAPSQLNLISGGLTLFEASNFNFFTASTNRMSILNNGDIGIGIGVPTSKLHVAGGHITMEDGNEQAGYIPVSNANGMMTWTDPSTITTSSLWSSVGNDISNNNLGDVGVGVTTNFNPGNYQITNTTGAKKTFTISSDPDGLIGNSLTSLVLEGSATTNGYETGIIDFVNTQGSVTRYNYARIAATKQNANNTYGALRFYTRIGASLSERMVINEYGNIGIGTSTPLDRLHVFETNNLDVLFQSSTGLTDFVLDAAVNRANIIFKRSGGIEGSMGYNLTNDYLFLNDGVESLVSKNGDIGIGTNTPTEKLDVNGDVVAHNYKYATPKARFLTIGDTDFRMDRTSAGELESSFGLGGVGIVNATGANALVTPIYLPQGAVVTNIEVYYVDNSPANMQVFFNSRSLTGGLSTISSATTSVNLSTVQTLNMSGTTIDNANNSYSLRVYSTGWPSTNALTMKIYTVKIHYSITETD